MAKGAFSGLPTVASWVNDLEARFGDLNEILGKVKTNFENGSTAIIGFTNATATLQNLIDEFVKQGGAAGGGGQRPDKATTTAEYDAYYADKLEHFERQIQAVMGEDNYFANQIATAVSGIRAGYISPGEALAYLQNQFGAFSAGLAQEIADPKTSPAMRELAISLQRLIASGFIPT